MSESELKAIRVSQLKFLDCGFSRAPIKSFLDGALKVISKVVAR